MIPGGLTANLLVSKLTINITISGNAVDVSIPTLALANGWDGSSAITVNLLVATGVILTASTTSTFALDESGLPVGSSVSIINKGILNASPGLGGAGGASTADGEDGGDGGSVFRATVPTSFDNDDGELNGGDGGDGGSTAVRGITPAGGTFFCNSSYYPNSYSCTAGTAGARGDDGNLTGVDGNDGIVGLATSASHSGFCSGGTTPVYGGSVDCPIGNVGSGGLAGKYAVGDSFITWVNDGIRLGGTS